MRWQLLFPCFSWLPTKRKQCENLYRVEAIISPSYTSAIAQAIQIPGIAGMENNMVVFEFDKDKPEELPGIADNFKLVNAGNFDVCILASSSKPVHYRNGIHGWIKTIDEKNSNPMILLSFIILGHPDWQKANIKIFDVCMEEDYGQLQKKHLLYLVFRQFFNQPFFKTNN